MTSNKKNSSIEIMLILILAVFLISCDKPTISSEPSPIEVRTKILTKGTWALASLKVDGVDRSDLFTGMTINLKEDNTFESTGGLPIWDVNGEWNFVDSEAQSIYLGDLQISVLTLTENTFEIKLYWSQNTIGEGRGSSIIGQYVFSFIR